MDSVQHNFFVPGDGVALRGGVVDFEPIEDGASWALDDAMFTEDVRVDGVVTETGTWEASLTSVDLGARSPRCTSWATSSSTAPSGPSRSIPAAARPPSRCPHSDGPGPLSTVDTMSIRTSRWPAGFPCWADLTVPDLDAGKAFYSSVLGWTFEDQGEEFGHYSIAKVKGANVAGISPPMQEGTPSVWTLYIASDDADKTAAAVKENGGSGALRADGRRPARSDVHRCRPVGRGLRGVAGEAAHRCWDRQRAGRARRGTTCAARTPTRRGRSTAQCSGSPADALPDAGADYTTFGVPGDDVPVGGMGGMFGAPEGTPSHWVAYFGTDDADTAAERVTANGGTLLAPPFETPYGKMTGVMDPFGAVFWIAEPDPSQQPDRSG